MKQQFDYGDIYVNDDGSFFARLGCFVPKMTEPLDFIGDVWGRAVVSKDVKKGNDIIAEMKEYGIPHFDLGVKDLKYFDNHRFMVYVLRKGCNEGWGSLLHRGMSQYYKDCKVVTCMLDKMMCDQSMTFGTYSDVFDVFEDGIEYYLHDVVDEKDILGAYEDRKSKGLLSAFDFYDYDESIKDDVYCRIIVEDATGDLKLVPMECFAPM